MPTANNLEQEWERLCIAEPRLLSLFNLAQKDAESWRGGNKYKVYKRYKTQLDELVGKHASNKEIRTSHDWDIAYQKIIKSSGLAIAINL